jgi:hypothetical protein
MLRKDVQTQNKDYNIEKLRVDDVIKNLPEWVRKKQEKSKVRTDKFKKIKLTDGTPVRYYEALSKLEGIMKFEDVNGNPLNVDDIFDRLPEDLQMKVYELMENKKL